MYACMNAHQLEVPDAQPDLTPHTEYNTVQCDAIQSNPIQSNVVCCDAFVILDGII